MNIRDDEDELALLAVSAGEIAVIESDATFPTYTVRWATNECFPKDSSRASTSG